MYNRTLANIENTVRAVHSCIAGLIDKLLVKNKLTCILFLFWSLRSYPPFSKIEHNIVNKVSTRICTKALISGKLFSAQNFWMKFD